MSHFGRIRFRKSTDTISFTLALLAFFTAVASLADEGSIELSRARVFSVEVEARGSTSVRDLKWLGEQSGVTELSGERELATVLVGETKSNAGGTVIYSDGQKIREAPIAEGTGRFSIRLSAISSGPRTVLIRIIDPYGKLHSDEVRVDFRTREAYRGFSAELGSSVSYLAYSENQGTNRVSIDELGLTVKGSLGWRLNPEWDLGGNVFLTAIPLILSASPAGLTTARWYGLNGRLGRALFRSGLDTSLTLSVGVYRWGMPTSATSSSNSPAAGTVYGVSTLGGPQLFLTYRSRTERGHAWYTYGKYALIQAGGGFHSSDREVALGGGYQPWTRSEAAKSWTLTADFALTQTSVFRLSSVSLGISRRL